MAEQTAVEDRQAADGLVLLTIGAAEVAPERRAALPTLLLHARTTQRRFGGANLNRPVSVSSNLLEYLSLVTSGTGTGTWLPSELVHLGNHAL